MKTITITITLPDSTPAATLPVLARSMEVWASSFPASYAGSFGRGRGRSRIPVFSFRGALAQCVGLPTADTAPITAAGAGE